MRRIRSIHAILAVVIVITSGCGLFDAAPLALDFDEVEWNLAHEDQFDRDYLGTDWMILRGDWHINEDHQLQIQRQWPSHSFIMSTIPLRGKNVKAELDFMIPSEQKGSFGVFIQAGPLGWGGGGVDDRVGLEFFGVAEENLDKSPANISLDEWHRVVIELVDGRYRVSVGDRVVSSGEVPQGRSLINSGLQFSACPGGMVDSLRIYTAPMTNPLPAISLAGARENRRATVFAEDFLDPEKSDWGFQAAIDALPDGGGVVVLPEGDFLMRRFLDVPSHTTLTGQGAGRTILRVIDATSAEVEAFSSENGVNKLVIGGEHDFRAGDAFSYGSSWGHPINSKAPGEAGHRHMLGGGGESENRLLILGVDGNTLTVNSPPPPDKRQGRLTITHFFPHVCSYESEFAEVKDLTLVGPVNNPAGARGGFSTNPITFGVASNSRFSRIEIVNFPADGISMQGCDDARVFDSTISGTAQGLHPGTTTIRMMVARNQSVDNGTGLFFCWYNTHGVYFRNLMKNMTGYPDAGDSFNTIASNRLTHPLHLTVGFNGCIFNNLIPSVTIFGARGGRAHTMESAYPPSGRTYGLPPRYFTIGMNTIERIALYRFAWGNVIAANLAAGGAPSDFAHMTTPDEEMDEQPENLILANDAEVAPIAELSSPIDRNSPVAPPEFPQPILDGREFYNPGEPDAGFQRALDRLAETGGTLRLPGGRYAIGQPLRIPSNVTLAGWGTGSILLPEGEVENILIVEDAGNVSIRDLAIEGGWSMEADRGPAILIAGGRNINLTAVDVRGWGGDAVSASGSNISVMDSRALRCAGAGFAFRNVERAVSESNSAVQCRDGFVVDGGSGAIIAGCISAINKGFGYRISGESPLLNSSNAHNNLHDGILVENALGAVIAGNTIVANNQAGGEFAGIRLGNGSLNARVLFNNCGDPQLYASQLVGIREEPGSTRSEIRFNVTATLCVRRGHEEMPSLISQGRESQVDGNWTETLTPALDSIEVIEYLRAARERKE